MWGQRVRGRGNLPFLSDDTLGCQAKDVESSIANEAEIRGRSYGDARVEEGGVFDCIAVEPLGTKFEHGRRKTVMRILALGY